MMESLIKAGGVYNIALVVFHLLFWRIFNWKQDLQSLSFNNKAIIQVVNLCLTLVFVLFAFISLVFSKELLTTPLGTSLLVFMALFWFARSFMQIVFFRLEHWGSIAFLVFFFAGGVLYAIPAISVL
jgi:hypothetical protein